VTIPREKTKAIVMRSFAGLAAVLLASNLAGYSQQSPSAARETGEQAKIAVNTELVALPVRVTDVNGNFVSGLNKQDFRVYEDGREQKISLFEQEDTPVTVGLVVDHSRSMGPKLAEVAAAVAAFARSSNRRDEMFVVDFNDEVSIPIMGGKPFTNEAKELEKEVSEVSARGRTALYDGLAEALKHLKYGHLEKQALIIVSDGGDNASHEKFSEVLAEAQRSPVVIYSIVLVSENEEENPKVLQRLSKSTGGIAYFPEKATTIESISDQIARDLRQQYTLGFAPEKRGNAAAFRKIQVKVVAAGKGKLNVRSRPGYFTTEDVRTAGQSSKGAL
jgi:Ca-activated chloride channel family protein